MEFVRNFNVPLAWRNQYCGVFKARHQGVVYYFLDNEYYFKRDNLYGYYDDAERFAFFSKVAMEMLNYIDFDPDIVHANDWHTALVPVYLNTFYRGIPKYHDIKTVFTHPQHPVSGAVRHGDCLGCAWYSGIPKSGAGI